MLNPPSGSCRSRIDRRTFRIRSAFGGLQLALRRMQPELQQNVVRFQRGVRQQVAAPEPVRLLQVEQRGGRPGVAAAQPSARALRVTSPCWSALRTDTRLPGSKYADPMLLMIAYGQAPRQPIALCPPLLNPWIQRPYPARFGFAHELAPARGRGRSSRPHRRKRGVYPVSYARQSDQGRGPSKTSGARRNSGRFAALCAPSPRAAAPYLAHRQPRPAAGTSSTK